MLCIILISLINIAIAETIQVPGDFNTIQAAINAAKAGDTVLVAKGEYPGELKLKSGVSLLAEEEGVILTEQLTAERVKDCTVEGFTLLDGKVDSLFAVWIDSAGVTLRDNAILKWQHGITAILSEVSIEGNMISSSSVVGGIAIGVNLSLCKKVLLQNNEIADTEGAGVIITDPGGGTLVSGNLIARNAGNGIECINATPEVKLRRNRIIENQVGIWITSGKPDIGVVDDPGGNIIHSSKGAEIVNNGRDTIPAQLNYWGAPNGPGPNAFEGRVTHEPFLKTEPGENLAIEPLLKLITTWSEIKRGF
jgi:nitrous oxidase accessory protein NosD